MTSIKWLLLLGTAAAAACTSDSAAGPPAPPCNATLATDLALGSHWCHRRGPARTGKDTAEIPSPPQLPFPPFFFNDTATTEIYTLSLHDALPISRPHVIPPDHDIDQVAVTSRNGGSGRVHQRLRRWSSRAAL